ncbi:hypothetical protein Tco_0535942 [Tanacetum coccineum]
MPYSGVDFDFVLTSLNEQTLSSRSGNFRFSSVFNPFEPLSSVFHALSKSVLTVVATMRGWWRRGVGCDEVMMGTVMWYGVDGGGAVDLWWGRCSVVMWVAMVATGDGG